ncbi:hypothetical protein OIU84_013768 [Salix udensis]|uniref:Uncharacterized protein n=1 Tax=Salix udensis TaxID=889485 RepID=A0AAD6NV43_9ROSI|nr:hypothetical protein OIU84_013768 [Salix udensis]
MERRDTMNCVLSFSKIKCFHKLLKTFRHKISLQEVNIPFQCRNEPSCFHV